VTGVFADRFEGSRRPQGSRIELCFSPQLGGSWGRIRDEWGFIDDETLRSNITSELQKVQFDVLFVNAYNVYYSPEAMTMKHAIIAVASVVEAVLEVAVYMVEDDPNVRPIIESKERVFDEMYTLQLKDIVTPDGVRVVSGVQREVIRSRLNKNTKMDLLIRAANAGGVIDEKMMKKLRQLQRLRNRVHIKTVAELEHQSYKHVLANGALDILEEFRVAAGNWIVSRRTQEFMEAISPATSQRSDPRDADDDIQF
jgi:hypothetical protein